MKIKNYNNIKTIFQNEYSEKMKNFKKLIKLLYD